MSSEETVAEPAAAAPAPAETAPAKEEPEVQEESKSLLVKMDNMSGLATKEQIDQLLGLCGAVKEAQLFTSTTGIVTNPVNPKVLYVTFSDEAGASVCRHLHTVRFIDRVLDVTRVDAIPEGLVVAGALPGRVGGDDYRRALIQVIQGATIQPPPMPLQMPPPQMPPPVQPPGGPPPMQPPVAPVPPSSQPPTGMPVRPVQSMPVVVAPGQAMLSSFTKVTNKQPPVVPMVGDVGISGENKIEQVAQTVYVGNLAPTVTAGVLGQIFKDCGTITKILPTGMAQPTKRFAFVTFATDAMAQKAVEKNGMVVAGTDLRMQVKLSKTKAASKKKLPSAGSGEDGGGSASDDGEEDGDRDRDRSRRSRRGSRDRDRDRSRRGGRDRDRDRRDRDRDRSRRGDRDRDRSRRDRSRSPAEDRDRSRRG